MALFSLQNAGVAEQRAEYIGDASKRYAMVIDLRRCVGCHACTAACIVENDVPREQFRSFVAEHECERAGRMFKAFLPELCNHCENPPCVRVCPTGATFARRDGLVLVDAEACWGCGACVNACPYDKRFINSRSKVADKCTFCAHKLDRGELPACVQTCVGRARIFGDLADPNSPVSRALAKYPAQQLKPHYGTAPKVYYIGLSGELAEPGTEHKMLQDIARKLDGAVMKNWRIR